MYHNVLAVRELGVAAGEVGFRVLGFWVALHHETLRQLIVALARCDRKRKGISLTPPGEPGQLLHSVTPSAVSWRPNLDKTLWAPRQIANHASRLLKLS